MTFEELRHANTTRCNQKFHPVCDWSPSDWACAIAGEAGEVCNAVKKLKRHENGTNTSKDPQTREAHIQAIANEIADTIIYLDLLAASLGISLPISIRDKFNIVSTRIGSNITL